MKKKILYNFILTFSAAIFLVISLSVCEIALGPHINIRGPVVKIVSPSLEENQEEIPVNTVFNLKGTARSNNGVDRMEVKLDFFDRTYKTTIRLDREWKFESNVWYYKEDANKEWRVYSASDYESVFEIEEHYWNLSGETVSWNVPITLKDYIGTGDVFITVSAWDRPGNHDSESTERIKVYYNNREPQFMILSPLSPVLRMGVADLPGGGFRNPDVPPEFENYIYDPINRPDATRNFISSWVTDAPWQIKYLIDDEAVLPLTLVMEFTNKHHLDTQEGKVVYHRHEETITAKMGSIDVGAIAVGMNLNGSSPTYMQIVTRLTDPVGNEQYRSQGFFAYLPEAEKPWTIIDFAHFEDPVKAFLLRNQKNGNNIAYGKNFLDSVSWVLTRLDELTLAPTSDTWTETNIYSDNSFTRSWEFTANGEYGIAPFKIDVTVQDKAGNSGVYSGYFNIESNATPRIKEITKPSGNTPFFGDSTGNVVIEGYAEIEGGVSQETYVSSVVIAWIRPDAPNTANARLIYSDRTYEGWFNVPLNGRHDTVNGVMLWRADSLDFINTTDLDNYRFSKNLNLFNDLNIGLGAGKFSVSEMAFIVRVASNTDTASNPKASTYQFTTEPDRNDPSLELKKVFIQREGGAPVQELAYPLVDSMISTIKATESIWFEGSWNDDSREAWSGLTENVLRSKFGNLSVAWRGEATNIPLQVSQFTANPGGGLGGIWRTAPLNFSNNNTEAIVNIIISLSDLSGNTRTIDPLIMIETDNPTLALITSTTSDGIYGNNKFTDVISQPLRPVFIDLVFNKPVKFHDADDTINASNAPYLNLNNGGRAFYLGGNNTSTINFIYYVDGVIGSNFATPGYGGDSSNGKLNVTSIAFNGFSQSKWVSVDAGTMVNIPAGVFNPASSTSLAGMTNIVIDKEPPSILGFTSTTASSREHGIGSIINININFSEDIAVEGNTGNLSLELTGVTGGAPAVATFTNITGTRSIGFSYTVTAGQNTGANVLGIAGFNLGSNVSIVDDAENLYVQGAITNGTIFNGQTPANLRVKTSLPAAPSVSIIRDGAVVTAGTQYQNVSFRINGLLTNVSANTIVEYTLNFNGDQSAWTTLTQPIQGSAGNFYADIPLTINGSYQIAARQYDNANPRNMSAVSGAVNVTLDKGNILDRITSSTSDGIYSSGAVIYVDLVFRKPIWFTGTTPANASLTLNNGQTAVLVSASSHSADMRTWTYRFTANTAVNRLDVTAINFGAGASFSDAASGGTIVNDWIRISAGNEVAALPVDKRLSQQKSIQILTGNPTINNPTLGNGIVYNGTANTLQFTFNRDVYPGDTANMAIIKQVAANYRIPVVLSIAEYEALFIGRTDLNTVTEITGRPGGYATNAEWWRWIGSQLYSQGTNGADSAYVSDTATKYVLRYDISSTLGSLPSGMQPDMPTAANLITIFREAEALRFNVNDREVSITGAALTLRIPGSLTGAKKLPVRGATYQVILPNGYVKDFLENPNGGLLTGNNVNIDNLVSTGVEPPVIRIDKGQEMETINGTGNNRQAVQPLTAGVKIDCRTPGAVLTYRTQQTTDNVGRLVWRANPMQITGTGATTTSNRLPNLGSQVLNDYVSYNAAANRPQSGQTGTGHPWGNFGMNLWEPMGAMPANFTAYTINSEITIGTVNGTASYNHGGMIIHIQARAASGGITLDSYEAAYRSVLVFQNVNVNGNNNNLDVGANLTAGRARMWIRGGDTTSGGSSIPGFPLSRDRTQSRKARLLTPIDTGTITNFNNLANATNAAITNSNIPAAYTTTGYYMWFWVTWKLNVNAYIDVFASELPVSGTAPQVPTALQKDIFSGWIMAKEHFPVIPGRTTVLETRENASNEYVDGGHGQPVFGSVMPVPTPSDP